MRSCVNWGERWKSGEECKRKWGEEKIRGGIRDGRGVDSEVKMGEGVSEGESPNRKDGLVLRKGECGGKRVGRSLENRQISDAKWGEQEKRALLRAKNGSGSSKKRQKSGLEWRKARKTDYAGQKNERAPL